MALKKGVKQLVAEAEETIETIGAGDALKLHGGEDVVFVDLRDVREVDRDSMVPGALHVPRGMLEFWVGPESLYHKDVFASGKRFVLYCNLGWRSALAAKVLGEMGLEPVCHVSGGFEGWKAAGGEVAERKKKG